MGFQNDVQTGVFTALAFAAESLALPALGVRPSKGTDADWSDNASGGVWEGWTLAATQFGADDVTGVYPDGTNDVVIDPPLKEKKVATVYRKVRTVPDSIVFTNYTIGEELVPFYTNAAVTTGVTTYTAAQTTKRAVFFEIGGIGGWYFPSCEIFPVSEVHGVQIPSSGAVMINVDGTAAIPSGGQKVTWADV